MASKDASSPSALVEAYPQVACFPTDDQLVATYVAVWRQYDDQKYAPECSIKPYQTIKLYTSALPRTQEGDSIVQRTHLAVVRDRRQVSQGVIESFRVSESWSRDSDCTIRDMNVQRTQY